MPATLRLPVSAPPEHLQIAQRTVADNYHVGATSTVATVRPATRHVGLTAERDGPISTAAGLHEYARSVLKHRLIMAR
jgi:hypothetical protein